MNSFGERNTKIVSLQMETKKTAFRVILGVNCSKFNFTFKILASLKHYYL
jgi:hypothetical protein